MRQQAVKIDILDALKFHAEHRIFLRSNSRFAKRVNKPVSSLNEMMRNRNLRAVIPVEGRFVMAAEHERHRMKGVAFLKLMKNVI